MHPWPVGLKWLPGWSSSTPLVRANHDTKIKTSEKNKSLALPNLQEICPVRRSCQRSDLFCCKRKSPEKNATHFFFHLTHFALVFAIPPHLCFLFCNLETINIHVLFESSKIYSHLLSSEDLWAMQKTFITAFFGKHLGRFQRLPCEQWRKPLCIPWYWPEQPQTLFSLLMWDSLILTRTASLSLDLLWRLLQTWIINLVTFAKQNLPRHASVISWSCHSCRFTSCSSSLPMRWTIS